MPLDEVEFRQVYNQACDAIVGITDNNTKLALSLCLQLVHALREQLDSMQIEEDF